MSALHAIRSPRPRDRSAAVTRAAVGGPAGTAGAAGFAVPAGGAR